MTEITFPNEVQPTFEREVIRFTAVVDGKEWPCQLTLDEMMREFGCGNPGTFEHSFRKLRPQIEERAKKRILEQIAAKE
jgi:hypothetical protein